ncbi:MAG: two-component regulator propeller domain-containing protein [Acidobacteriota bacterium]|nr:two-component regulator propeller domain-containing protein [Acidobacteriota bacterium]
MWFGTESGLNKYDGYQFTVYVPVENEATSLSNPWINVLLTDRKGNLWVGTENGLNKYINSTDHFVRYFHNPDDPDSLSSSRIFCLLEDRKGRLWVGTEAGLNLFDRAQNRFIRYQHDPANPSSLSHDLVLAITEDRQGFIWVGTGGGGLNRLDPVSGRFTHLRQDTAHPDNSLPDNYILSLLATKVKGSESLWIGTVSSGLVRYSLSTKEFKTFRPGPGILDSLSDNFIRCIMDDVDGTLWVGTNAGGLCHFDPEQEKFVSFKHQSHDQLSLADNRVLCLCFAPEHILWVGTYRGISQVNLDYQNFIRFVANPADPTSLSHPAVRAFCEDNSDRLLVGTDGGGLDIFDRKNLRTLHFRHEPENPNSLSSNSVSSILRDNDGTFWIGTFDGGLNRFDPRTLTFRRYRHNPHDANSLVDDQVRCLLIDNKNRFWIGTVGSGLVSYDRASGRFFRPKISKITHLGKAPGQSTAEDQSALPNPLLSGRIFHMTQDKAGYLWIGCFGEGLVRYHPESGDILHFTRDQNDPRSLSNNSIINVFIDSNGYIWAGTNGGGLNRLDPSTLAFTRYNESHGLPTSVIYAVLEDDDGYLWISSNRGLSRFDPRTNQTKNFDTSDGLQSYEFNGNAYMKSKNGHLYFGGINGFNVFNPKEIKASNYLTPVVITNFLISNQPVKPGQMVNGQVVLRRSINETRYLELRWMHRVIGFEFAGLNYACPQKNQYAYILEGFDKDWNYVGTRRFASYSNLPPGRYTLRVKACNCDGVWNETGTLLRLKIIPPLWRTWWFHVLEIIMLGGLIYTGFLWRTKQIRQHQKELENLIARRTEELKLANEKLQLLATTDEMTRLANYRKFRDYLEYEWRRARRTHGSISLIICDLDDFKFFNDTYGHQAGDECLKRVAMEMAHGCQRSSDLACRYGGDEFAIVLPETDTAGAYIIADRIRKAIDSLDLAELGFKEISDSQSGKERKVLHRGISMSLGLATMKPEEGGEADDLIARADQALYRAKTSGKNGIEI